MLPAPSKTGHALFPAASLLAGSCQSRLFSINCPAVVQFAAGLCHTRFTCICGRQLPSLRPFRRRLPKPCTLCQYAATKQPGCRQEKAGPPGPAFLLSKRSHYIIIHQTSPPAYSPSRFLTAWTEAPVGFCMFFSRVFSSKIGVRRNCNRIVIIFLSNLSPIWLRKSLRKRNKDVSSSIHLFIHRK